MAERADAYVLETYANGVRVQVSLPAPREQMECVRLNVRLTDLKVYESSLM